MAHSDICNILKHTKLDAAVAAASEDTNQKHLGAQDVVCGRPTPQCSPCGDFGPVRCPCMLNCAPIGARCHCIEQPRCTSCVPGCCMCCGSHGVPRQPSGRPRCCTRRCM